MINIGDSVKFFYGMGYESGEGIVMHMPQATGDCWIIETDDSFVYLQNFGSIHKVKEEPT